MTCKERINAILHSQPYTEADAPATLEKLVCLAYYFGREDAAREISDKYVAHIAQQHARANACRYAHMANAIVGAEQYLYSSDYAQDMQAMFGNDLADI